MREYNNRADYKAIMKTLKHFKKYPAVMDGEARRYKDGPAVIWHEDDGGYFTVHKGDRYERF